MWRKMPNAADLLVRSDYIVSLIAAASEKQGEIEQALISGIKSGSAEPWTDDEWQAIRNRVVAKAAIK